MNLTYVFYSHYDYSDVWPLMFGQSDKFLKNQKKVLFSNKVGEFNTDGWEVILYDESLPYQKRFASCLEKMNDEIIMIHHEDMFLMKTPKWDEIDKVIKLVEDNTIDIIKVCKASYNNTASVRFSDNLYLNPNNLLFAIQPTIIKKSTLHTIYDKTLGASIWEFEKNSSLLVNMLGLKSCYYYDGSENKRGLYHWDSSLYPYIATAVVKGKWDVESYGEELRYLLKEYSIDENLRGTNG